ncbi:hypothetical protein Tco_1357905 [Tanacetum coccineum]
MKTKGKSVKIKLFDECVSDYHLTSSRKQNVNFDTVAIDSSDMIVDNEIQKPPIVQQRVHPLVVQQHVQPSVVQQHVQPQPLHMVAGNMVEKDLATRDHVDIHGKENSYSCAIDPSFKICLEGADTTTCKYSFYQKP